MCVCDTFLYVLAYFFKLLFLNTVSGNSYIIEKNNWLYNKLKNVAPGQHKGPAETCISATDLDSLPGWEAGVGKKHNYATMGTIRTLKHTCEEVPRSIYRQWIYN